VDDDEGGKSVTRIYNVDDDVQALLSRGSTQRMMTWEELSATPYRNTRTASSPSHA